MGSQDATVVRLVQEAIHSILKKEVTFHSTLSVTGLLCVTPDHKANDIIIKVDKKWKKLNSLSALEEIRKRLCEKSHRSSKRRRKTDDARWLESDQTSSNKIELYSEKNSPSNEQPVTSSALSPNEHSNKLQVTDCPNKEFPEQFCGAICLDRHERSAFDEESKWADRNSRLDRESDSTSLDSQHKTNCIQPNIDHPPISVTSQDRQTYDRFSESSPSTSVETLSKMNFSDDARSPQKKVSKSQIRCFKRTHKLKKLISVSNRCRHVSSADKLLTNTPDTVERLKLEAPRPATLLPSLINTEDDIEKNAWSSYSTKQLTSASSDTAVDSVVSQSNCLAGELEMDRILAKSAQLAKYSSQREIEFLDSFQHSCNLRKSESKPHSATSKALTENVRTEHGAMRADMNLVQLLNGQEVEVVSSAKTLPIESCIIEGPIRDSVGSSGNVMCTWTGTTSGNGSDLSNEIHINYLPPRSDRDVYEVNASVKGPAPVHATVESIDNKHDRSSEKSDSDFSLKEKSSSIIDLSQDLPKQIPKSFKNVEILDPTKKSTCSLQPKVIKVNATVQGPAPVHATVKSIDNNHDRSTEESDSLRKPDFTVKEKTSSITEDLSQDLPQQIPKSPKNVAILDPTKKATCSLQPKVIKVNATVQGPAPVHATVKSIDNNHDRSTEESDSLRKPDFTVKEKTSSITEDLSQDLPQQIPKSPKNVAILDPTKKATCSLQPKVIKVNATVQGPAPVHATVESIDNNHDRCTEESDSLRKPDFSVKEITSSITDISQDLPKQIPKSPKNVDILNPRKKTTCSSTPKVIKEMPSSVIGRPLFMGVPTECSIKQNYPQDAPNQLPERPENVELNNPPVPNKSSPASSVTSGPMEERSVIKHSLNMGNLDDCVIVQDDPENLSKKRPIPTLRKKPVLRNKKRKARKRIRTNVRKGSNPPGLREILPANNGASPPNYFLSKFKLIRPLPEPPASLMFPPVAKQTPLTPILIVNQNFPIILGPVNSQKNQAKETQSTRTETLEVNSGRSPSEYSHRNQAAFFKVRYCETETKRKSRFPDSLNFIKSFTFPQKQRNSGNLPVVTCLNSHIPATNSVVSNLSQKESYWSFTFDRNKDHMTRQVNENDVSTLSIPNSVEDNSNENNVEKTDTIGGLQNVFQGSSSYDELTETETGTTDNQTMLEKSCFEKSLSERPDAFSEKSVSIQETSCESETEPQSKITESCCFSSGIVPSIAIQNDHSSDVEETIRNTDSVQSMEPEIDVVSVEVTSTCLGDPGRDIQITTSPGAENPPDKDVNINLIKEENLDIKVETDVLNVKETTCLVNNDSVGFSHDWIPQSLARQEHRDSETETVEKQNILKKSFVGKSVLQKQSTVSEKSISVNETLFLESEARDQSENVESFNISKGSVPSNDSQNKDTSDGDVFYRNTDSVETIEPEIDMVSIEPTSTCLGDPIRDIQITTSPLVMNLIEDENLQIKTDPDAIHVKEATCLVNNDSVGVSQDVLQQPVSHHEHTDCETETVQKQNVLKKSFMRRYILQDQSSVSEKSFGETEAKRMSRFPGSLNFVKSFTFPQKQRNSGNLPVVTCLNSHIPATNSVVSNLSQKESYWSFTFDRNKDHMTRQVNEDDVSTLSIPNSVEDNSNENNVEQPDAIGGLQNVFQGSLSYDELTESETETTDKQTMLEKSCFKKSLCERPDSFSEKSVFIQETSCESKTEPQSKITESCCFSSGIVPSIAFQNDHSSDAEETIRNTECVQSMEPEIDVVSVEVTSTCLGDPGRDIQITTSPGAENPPEKNVNINLIKEENLEIKSETDAIHVKEATCLVNNDSVGFSQDVLQQLSNHEHRDCETETVQKRNVLKKNFVGKYILQDQSSVSETSVSVNDTLFRESEARDRSEIVESFNFSTGSVPINYSQNDTTSDGDVFNRKTDTVIRIEPGIDTVATESTDTCSDYPCRDSQILTSPGSANSKIVGSIHFVQGIVPGVHIEDEHKPDGGVSEQQTDRVLCIVPEIDVVSNESNYACLSQPGRDHQRSLEIKNESGDNSVRETCSLTDNSGSLVELNVKEETGALTAFTAIKEDRDGVFLTESNVKTEAKIEPGAEEFRSIKSVLILTRTDQYDTVPNEPTLSTITDNTNGILSLSSTCETNCSSSLKRHLQLTGRSTAGQESSGCETEEYCDGETVRDKSPVLQRKRPSMTPLVCAKRRKKLNKKKKRNCPAKRTVSKTDWDTEDEFELEINSRTATKPTASSKVTQDVYYQQSSKCGHKKGQLKVLTDCTSAADAPAMRKSSPGGKKNAKALTSSSKISNLEKTNKSAGKSKFKSRKIVTRSMKSSAIKAVTSSKIRPRRSNRLVIKRKASFLRKRGVSND